MLATVKQATIAHEVVNNHSGISLISTDEYKIPRPIAWGYYQIIIQEIMLKASMPVWSDGDGFCEVHVNTLGRFWSLLFLATTTSRISQANCRCILAFFGGLCIMPGEERLCFQLSFWSAFTGSLNPY